jgi:Protein of unknown function (DUF4035)
LTLAIGGCTVDELQSRMSYAEFMEWAAFAESEPLPGARSDLQTAMLMTLTASVNQGKGGHKLKLTDFLPDWWQEKRSPMALLAKFRALTTSEESTEANGRRTPEPDRKTRP